MNNKFLRQWTMLQCVPKRPKRITTRDLMDVLLEKGFEVTQRTIQRDLKTLSKVMPGLQVDTEKDFPGWAWSKDSLIQDIPAMDCNMALTLKLADHFLTTMFPPSILSQLKPYFDSADNVLQLVDKTGYPNWSDKVRILSRTQQLVPAVIQEDVVAVIYEALLKGKQFRGRYVRRDGDEVEYDIHPLGLIFRESIVYLVATIWDYQDPRHLALHRFKQCELLKEDSVAPEEFDLDSYLKTGSFDYCAKDGETIQLKVLFDYDAGKHLYETPLSKDQIITKTDNDRLQVEATVKDSGQLRWWLLGFGDYMKVLEPIALQEEFIGICQRMGDRYS